MVSYSSLSKLDLDTKGLYEDDDYDVNVWDPALEGGRYTATTSTSTSTSRASKQNHDYQLPLESEDFIDSGYNSSDQHCYSMEPNKTPEVNLKNVLGGIFAILTGTNRGQVGVTGQQPDCSSNLSFLEPGKNGGDSFLHASVCIPSAPPLLEPHGFNYSAYKEVLEADPPEWVPDSATSACMQCTSLFTPLTRGRHHCRFCGGIFCRVCSKGRCLLPVKFRERSPQRVCDTCYDRLDPLQGILINSISNAAQVAKHDVMDWTSTRGWLNMPVGLSMEYEIYKASNTLRSYCQVPFIYLSKLCIPV